jgi:tetracycline 7-halogenase / FADH2 O2-dependent halogenase
VVDATGDGQVLARPLGLEPAPPAALRAQSRALYSHFHNIRPWQDLLKESHDAAVADHPFRCDAAALHHVIDHGWMWVLRFDNGITSAGFSLDPNKHPIRADESPEQEWQRLLRTYPPLARQFQCAQAVRPLVRTGRLQRRWSLAAGPDWALLPHAAGFTDAWLSPGIAQTLFAVERLGRIMADGWHRPDRSLRLADYSRTLLEELAWVDEITAACFACFDRFQVLATVTMIYFVAAIFCEELERAGQGRPGFLLADDPVYRDIAATVFGQARNVSDAESDRFAAGVARALEPYNLAGLCDSSRRNMYPFVNISPLRIGAASGT